MPNITADPFPMEDTLCKNCEHRFSRVLLPIDYEMYDIDLDEFDLDDDEDLLIEQHICLASNQDLEGIVTECNKFKEAGTSRSLFTRNPFEH
jgi:hypothetical protein